jgi:hypothetical protein
MLVRGSCWSGRGMRGLESQKVCISERFERSVGYPLSKAMKLRLFFLASCTETEPHFSSLD